VKDLVRHSRLEDELHATAVLGEAAQARWPERIRRQADEADRQRSDESLRGLDGSMIGIQAIVMNGAQIGKNCIVGAGAVVTEGKVFPDNVLIVGCPAKVARELTGKDSANLDNNATEYVGRARRYKLTLEASG
jgi:hypothetical protein